MSRNISVIYNHSSILSNNAPLPLRMTPRTPCTCPKPFQPALVKGDRGQPCNCKSPNMLCSHHAASSPSHGPRKMHSVPEDHRALILTAKITNRTAHKIKCQFQWWCCTMHSNGNKTEKKQYYFLHYLSLKKQNSWDFLKGFL